MVLPDTDSTLPPALSDTSPTVKVCFLVLAYHDEDVLSKQQLIRRTRCSGSAVHRALDELERRGWVERVVDSERDMRHRYYRLKPPDDVDGD